MTPKIIWQLRFVLLVFLQVFFLDEITLLNYVTVQMYLLYIFIYPIFFKDTRFLFTAFLLGILIDIFRDTAGVNALATLLVAVLRPYVVQGLFGKKIGRAAPVLYFKTLLKKQKYTYVFLLTFLHHLLVVFIENISYMNFWEALLTVLLNTLLSGLLILFCIFLFFKRD